MRALITGATGQDGAYLSELLLNKGYEVYGLKRSESDLWRFNALGININFIEGQMEDIDSLKRALDISDPDEVYNLSAVQSFFKSSNDPVGSFDVNANGAVRLLESIRQTGKNIKMFQASTCEMYGYTDKPQNEKTLFHPRSPYGVAKVAAHLAAIYYRETYSMPVCCGILFSHESPLRANGFVTQKIAKAAKAIKEGKQKELHIGNMDSRRDWGHAKDYVMAMWMMLQNEPKEYIISTGKTHSVKQFIELAFADAGLDWRKHVVVDEKCFRPLDVPLLLGDSSKIKEELGWEPEYSFQDIVEEMVNIERKVA